LALLGAKTSTAASVEVPLPTGEEQVMVTVFVSPWVTGGAFASEQEILGVELVGGNVPVGDCIVLSDII
jgi:hypothetical protein